MLSKRCSTIARGAEIWPNKGRPKLSNNCPKVTLGVEIPPNFGQFWPYLADCSPRLAKLGQNLDSLDQNWPMLANWWPMFANVGNINIRPRLVNVGQLANSWQHLAKLYETLANMGQNRAESEEIWGSVWTALVPMLDNFGARQNRRG